MQEGVAMASYRKTLFDKCLVAIVSELEQVEREYPDWPENEVDAAKIISDKAAKLLSASSTHSWKEQRDNNLVLNEAVQTGAMVLRFLLGIENGHRYATNVSNERESYWSEEYD